MLVLIHSPRETMSGLSTSATRSNRPVSAYTCLMTELASDVRRDLTWQNQLSIALFDYVKLSVSQRLYVFDTTLRDASVANDVMVGLSFGVDRRLQTY